MDKLPISAIVVSYNEGYHLSNCLKSIQFCAEIIVVDLGSSDNSVIIALANNAKVYKSEKLAIVEEILRMHSQYASFDTLLLTDPDEVVSSELAEQIPQLIVNLNKDVGIVLAPIFYYFKKKKLKGTVWGGKNTRNFLVKKEAVTFTGLVHSGIKLKDGYKHYSIPFNGKNFIHHYWVSGYKNFIAKHSRYLKKEGEKMAQRKVKYYFKEQITQTRNAFYNCFITKKGYKDGFTGLLLSVLWGWYNWQKYSELRKLVKGNKADFKIAPSQYSTKKQPRVLLVSTYDRGGAGKACLRLHEGLLKLGVDSKLLIRFSKNKYPPESNIRVIGKGDVVNNKTPGLLRKILIRLRFGRKTALVQKEISGLLGKQLEIFSYPYSTFDLTQYAWYKESDIVHLHWVAGVLDYSFFRKNNKPVIWTLHDMNPFTGGCHYSKGCMAFTEKCSYCPQLISTSHPEYSSDIFNYKHKMFKSEAQITIVSLSKWLFNCSQQSTLFKDQHNIIIPNGIDSKIFKPHDRQYSRKVLGLPQNKIIFLFVAEKIDVPRKGSNYIFEAIKLLSRRQDILICAAGAFSEQHENLYLLGEINDEEKLAIVYSAADALLLPSLEDNLPNTALESLLCGTPVIGFANGGITDIIKDEENGYLCTDRSVTSLIEKIDLFIANKENLSRTKISEEAMAKYDISVSAEKYSNEYRKLLNISFTSH